MIAKLNDADLAAVGAKDATEFSAKLAAYVANTKKLEAAMAESITIESLAARIDALEKAPQGKLTEARVKELITAESAVPIKAFIASEEGKKLIGAEASRITMEALAATGTSPNKPSPAPAVTDSAADLEAAGEYEKAFATSKEIRAEFPNAACYAAYAKAKQGGRVRFNEPQEQTANN